MGRRSSARARGGRNPFAEGPYAEWQQKGATLSHKTAAKEYGLTWEEIVDAINAGKLQFRNAAMHGHPFLRLLRREVEALVEERSDGGEGDEVRRRLLEARMKKLDREIRRHRKEIKAHEAEIELLEDEKAVLRKKLEAEA